ncbi:MAG: cyclase family protein [Chloroflexota bacterium]|nr:cyclase family protein [Chloroflexota bacterium]
MEWPSGNRIYDISLPITPDLPTWPGDPAVLVESLSRISHGAVVNVSHVSMSSHTGTHVDAPWHFIEDGTRLVDIVIEEWIGPCLVIELPIDAQRIEPIHLDAIDLPPGTSRLLFKTSNSALWESTTKIFLESYVALSAGAARWIVAHDIKLVGIDYLSIEPFDDSDHETHRILLGQGVLVIEGLNLTAVAPGPYTLICLPLALAVGDGAPARVLLIAP